MGQFAVCSEVIQSSRVTASPEEPPKRRRPEYGFGNDRRASVSTNERYGGGYGRDYDWVMDDQIDFDSPPPRTSPSRDGGRRSRNSNHGGRVDVQSQGVAGTEQADNVEREDVLAISAKAAEESHESLEALWLHVAGALDAELAWWVGRGRNLDEPEFSALASASAARDSGALREGLQVLDGGGVDALRAEVERLCLGEERHIVLRELQAAILRADADDIDLWAEEAARLGADVHVEQRYCESLRAALREFAKHSDVTPFTTASAGSRDGEHLFETYSSWPDAASPGDNGAQYEENAEDAGEGDGEESNEELWAQLEMAMALNDVNAGLEAVALLESAGELDAESAAEVRSEVQAHPEPAAPAAPQPWQQVTASEARPARGSTTHERARSHDTADWGVPRHAPPRMREDDWADWEIPRRGPPRPREGDATDWRIPPRTPPRAQEVTGNESRIPPRAPSRPDTASLGERNSGSKVSPSTAQRARPSARPPSPPEEIPSSALPEQFYTTSKSQYRYAARPSGVAPVDQRKRSEPPAPPVRLFREAFWKRKVNLQTARRLRAESANAARNVQTGVAGSRQPFFEGSDYARGRSQATSAGADRNTKPPPVAPARAAPSATSYARQAHNTAAERDPGSAPYPRAANVGAEAPERDPGAFASAYATATAFANAAAGARRSQAADHKAPGGPRRAQSEGTRSTPGEDAKNTAGTKQREGRWGSKPPSGATSAPGAGTPHTASGSAAAAGGPTPGREPRPSSASGTGSPNAASGSAAGAGRPGGPKEAREPRFSSASGSGTPNAASGSAAGAGRPTPGGPKQAGSSNKSPPKRPSSSQVPPAGSRASGRDGPRREERRPAPARATDLEAAARELLELPPDFSVDDLRAAYKRAAMKWHPDRPAWRTAGEEEVKRATEMFQKMKDAYDLLLGKPSRP